MWHISPELAGLFYDVNGLLALDKLFKFAICFVNFLKCLFLNALQGWSHLVNRFEQEHG